MTRHWLELDDNGRILLLRDPGDGCDLEVRAVRDDYACPADLLARWHELDELRRDARAFGAACEAEAMREWEQTRGV